MKREIAIDIINNFPQEFELEGLLEQLIFAENVEKGLRQLEVGKTISHEEVKEIVKKWQM